MQNIDQQQNLDQKADFESSLRSGGILAEKYGKSDDPRTLERVKQYDLLAKDLIERSHEAPSQLSGITQELKLITEELEDALTRGFHNRTVNRKNRFDTDEEHARVQRESAEYFRYLDQQKDERRRQREAAESGSRENEQRWSSFQETCYRLIASNGQGSDVTINESAEELLKDIALLKSIKGESLRQWTSEIDTQLQKNRNLGPETLTKLRTLKEKIQ